jgi:hypothetical protein
MHTYTHAPDQIVFDCLALGITDSLYYVDTIGTGDVRPMAISILQSCADQVLRSAQYVSSRISRSMYTRSTSHSTYVVDAFLTPTHLIPT